MYNRASALSQFLSTVTTMFNTVADTVEAIPSEHNLSVSALSDTIGTPRAALRGVQHEAPEDMPEVRNAAGKVVTKAIAKGDKIPTLGPDGKQLTKEVQENDHVILADLVWRSIQAAGLPLVYEARGRNAGVWRDGIAKDSGEAKASAKAELSNTKEKLTAAEQLAAKQAADMAAMAKKYAAMQAQLDALLSKTADSPKGKGKGKSNDLAAE